MLSPHVWIKNSDVILLGYNNPNNNLSLKHWVLVGVHVMRFIQLHKQQQGENFSVELIDPTMLDFSTYFFRLSHVGVWNLAMNDKIF